MSQLREKTQQRYSDFERATGNSLSKDFGAKMQGWGERLQAKSNWNWRTVGAEGTERRITNSYQ